MYLKEKTKYAPKGAFLTIFKRPHPTVWLAEYNGDKFSVSPDLLSDTPPVDDVVIVDPLKLF